MVKLDGQNRGNGDGPDAPGETNVCRREGLEAPPTVGSAGPRRGDEAPQNAREADDSGELLAREAPGKRGGDAGGGCSAASR